MKKFFTTAIMAALLGGSMVFAADQVIFIGDTGYDDLASALAAATDGQEIVLKGNISVNKSISPVNNNVVVKGENKDVTITLAKRDASIIRTGNKTITYKDLTIQNHPNDTRKNSGFEGQNGGVLKLENVKITGFKFEENLATSNSAIVVGKNGGKFELNNCEFVDNNDSYPNIFVGAGGSKITGVIKNANIYVENTYSINAERLTGEAPIKLTLEPEKRTNNQNLIENNTNLSLFSVMNNGYKLEEKDGNLIMAVAEQSAVNEIEGVDENAPVEYYNLQGMKVNGELTPGIYVRRQGGKTVKVLVK